MHPRPSQIAHPNYRQQFYANNITAREEVHVALNTVERRQLGDCGRCPKHEQDTHLRYSLTPVGLLE